VKKGLILWAVVFLFVVFCPEGDTQGAFFEAAAAADSGKLVVYTSNSEDFIKPIIQEFENKTGIRVETVTAGAGELLKRIQTEVNNPQGDVQWGGAISSLGSVAEQYFEPYTSANEDAIYKDYKNTDGHVTRFTLVIRCLIVNKNLKGDMKIDGYADLLAQELKGKIAACDPAQSSSAFGHLTNQLYAMGNGNPEGGWDYMEKFVSNLDNKLLNSSSAVWKGVADGEYTVGLTYEEVASKAMMDGAPVEVVYMKEGVFAEPDGVAIIKNAKNLDNAKRFLDFLTSMEIQALISNKLNRRGVRDDISLAEGLTPIDRINLISSNSKLINEKKQEWLDKFKDILTR
jgi:iron(III) transport system substrate-binding protein